MDWIVFYNPFFNANDGGSVVTVLALEDDVVFLLQPDWVFLEGYIISNIVILVLYTALFFVWRPEYCFKLISFVDNFLVKIIPQ